MTTPLETECRGHGSTLSHARISGLRCLNRMAGLMLALQIATLLLLLQIFLRLPS